MAKVFAPNTQYTGLSASVMFLNGVAETDNENLLEWFESRGYTVERHEVEQEDISIEKMTVAQLKEYAKAQMIYLGDASKKDDILAVIVQHEQQDQKPDTEPDKEDKAPSDGEE